jgi:hypothetical protein
LVGKFFVVLSPEFDPNSWRRIVSVIHPEEVNYLLGNDCSKMKIMIDTMKMIVGTQPTDRT